MAAAETTFLATPFQGAGGVIASPFQFVADADTFLRVRSACSMTNVVLALQGRRIDANGQLQALVETHAPNSDRTVKTQDYGLGVGALLNLTVFATAGNPQPGQVYVLVQLLRNVGGTAMVLGTLLAGFVTTTQALGFPGSPIQSSLEGPGAVRFIRGTLPAPGGVVAEVPPTGARWEVVAASTTFTTDATAVTRYPFFVLQQGVVVPIQVTGTAGIGAASTRVFTWGKGLAVNTSAMIPAETNGAPIELPIRSIAAFSVQAYNLQAGDQFSAPDYVVREWLEVL